MDLRIASTRHGCRFLVGRNKAPPEQNHSVDAKDHLEPCGGEQACL